MPVRALLHYALEVPDQTAGERFYQAFGLTGAGGARDAAVRLRPATLARDAVLLYGGRRKRRAWRSPRPRQIVRDAFECRRVRADACDGSKRLLNGR